MLRSRLQRARGAPTCLTCGRLQSATISKVCAMNEITRSKSLLASMRCKLAAVSGACKQVEERLLALGENQPPNRRLDEQKGSANLIENPAKACKIVQLPADVQLRVIQALEHPVDVLRLAQVRFLPILNSPPSPQMQDCETLTTCSTGRVRARCVSCP